MATYYKYVERNAEDNINWAEVGKSMSDMLQQEAQAREAKKAALAKDSVEYGETLSNAPSGDYDAGNTFAADYSDAQQEYRLMQDRMFQNGQLSLRDYTRNRQNGKDGTTMMFDLAKEYEAEFVDKMKRWKEGTSSYEEVWKMEQAEGLANLRNVGAYINPTNGVVSIGRKVTTGTGNSQTTTLSKNANDVVTVPQLRNRIKQKVNSLNVDEFSSGAADQLGAIESAVVKYGGKGNLNVVLTEIDAKTGDYGVEGDAFAATYLDWEKDQIEAGLRNPSDAASILTNRSLKAPNGEQYTFTYEKDAQKRKKNEIYLDQTTDPNGVPKLSKEQEDAAIDILKTGIRAAIDKKTQIKTAGYQPKDTATDVAIGNREQAQVDVVNNFGKIFYGTTEEKKAAADSIRAYNKNVQDISLTEDGMGIRIEFADGQPPETIEFGTDQQSFIESGMNFILPEGQKIANIDEVVTRGKIDLTKPVLAGTEYAFNSRGEITETLPFKEAYIQKEGQVFDTQTILFQAGAGITDDQEKNAKDRLQSQIDRLPMLKGITVDTFNWGHGLKVKIPKTKNTPAKTKEINLEDPTLASTQLADVIDVLLALAANKADMMMEKEEKDEYAKTYGSYKKDGQDNNSNTNKGGGVPRKNK